jgi:hypothetical protein
MKKLKTLDLLDRLISEALDPTEVSDNAEAPPETEADAEAPVEDEPVEQKKLPLTSEGEKFLIKLLIKAFAHAPDEEELKIVDAVNLEFMDVNPKQIADTIAQLIDSTDQGFVDILGNT